MLLFIIVLPVLVINSNDGGSLGILDFIGLAVWLFGFYFEAIGDAQLARFMKNPANKGKLIQSGLWAYTRHPNYFGEVALWWGIWLIALAVPNGVFAIVGPLTITFLILYVSGREARICGIQEKDKQVYSMASAHSFQSVSLCNGVQAREKQPTSLR